MIINIDGVGEVVQHIDSTEDEKAIWSHCTTKYSGYVPGEAVAALTVILKSHGVRLVVAYDCRGEPPQLKSIREKEKQHGFPCGLCGAKTFEEAADKCRGNIDCPGDCMSKDVFSDRHEDSTKGRTS